MLRARIQSRHRSTTKYHIYVLVDMAKRAAESVLHYCCQCKSGLRTVRGCANVMTVLWFFGYARHISEILIPAESLDNIGVTLESTDSEQD